jgi:glycopeptide antibiotics resistance protein
MVAIFSLLIPAIGFWAISVMSGQRQKVAVQAIEGGLEALIINILFMLLIVFLGSSMNVQATDILWNLMGLGVLQLLYVIPRSLFLRRKERWVKLKGLIAASIIIVLIVALFRWWLMSIPW